MRTLLTFSLLLALGLGSMNAQVQDRFKTKTNDSTATASDEAKEDRSSASSPSLEEEDFWDRVVIGGNASLSFGNYTFIYLAPTVGYKFTDNLVAGPGFIYQYARIDASVSNVSETYENSIYGPKAFVNYLIAQRFYAGLQYEYLNHDIPFINGSTLEFQNTWTPVLFLEAGLISPIGNKGYAQIGMRYNVLDGPDSPYATAFFPFIGFLF